MSVRSEFSATSRALTVKAFETCASCASAPVQGPAKAGHVAHTANSSDLTAILTPSFLGHGQDLVCFYVAQHLHRSTRPLQFDFLDDRIRAQSKVNARIVRTRVTSSCRDVVVLHKAGCGCHFDSRSDAVTVAFHPDGLDQNPMIAAG